MGKSMGKGKFRPPTAPKPLNRFWWNSKLRTTTWRPPTTQDFISMRRRGWSRRIASLPLSGFCLCVSFFWSLRHAHRSHRWTDFDNLYIISRVSGQRLSFGGRDEIAPHLGDWMPPKHFRAWIGVFKPNLQNIKTCILSKLLHRFQPNFAQW